MYLPSSPVVAKPVQIEVSQALDEIFVQAVLVTPFAVLM